MAAIDAAMPNIADTRVAAAATLPHAVHLPDLSFRALGEGFGPAFGACQGAARAVAGDGWAASAVHEAGMGTSYVFRFACPMASLRFSARAAVATTGHCFWPARWHFG